CAREGGGSYYSLYNRFDVW
nr:immunoglobulin heavy chain junction region [Macaca mulatta]MOW88985.1 immunoglobulin heavy chain junction region [Macaca mulatta]MOW89533.1 immunoglobulin heavy chain junction region [Macaca mulatta]MOW90304.1 immunoglobulin heavy chain junction region [Macaca mulatta]MOW91013.1 immunoglobulin heavy chain junction region [Macaca mulatta]